MSRRAKPRTLHLPDTLPFAAASPATPAASEVPPVALGGREAEAASEPHSGLGHEVAIRELESFDPRLLSGLPAPSVLSCRTADGTAVVITTCANAYESNRLAHNVVFTGRELCALALATEHDRASPAVFAEWCARKRAEPAWQLTAVEAIGHVHGRFEPLGWPLGRVLRRLGLQLTAAEVVGVPAYEYENEVQP